MLIHRFFPINANDWFYCDLVFYCNVHQERPGKSRGTLFPSTSQNQVESWLENVKKQLRANPHWLKICLFRQNFCHQRSRSADDLSRLDKCWPKRTKLEMHRRKKFVSGKTELYKTMRLNKQNFVYLVMSKAFNHVHLASQLFLVLQN